MGERSKTPDTTSAANPRRWPRRLLVSSVCLVVCYTLFGFFGVPLLIRKVGIPQLNKRLNATATLAEAACNPYTFSLRLKGFELVDLKSTRVLSFDEFSTNFELFATVFRDGWFLDHVRVSNAFFDASLSKEGRLSLIDLVKPSQGPAAPSDWTLTHIPRVIIRDVMIEKTGAHFTDFSTPEIFEKTVEDLNLHLTQIDTRPDNDNPVTFSANTRDGETLTWVGSIRVDPLSSKGEFEVASAVLPSLMPYAMSRTEAVIESGTLALTGEYELALFRTDRVARATLTTITIDSLKTTQPDGRLADAGKVTLRGVAVDAIARRIEVEDATIEQGTLSVRRAKDGLLSLTRLLVQADEAVVEARAESSASAPERRDPRTISSPFAQIRVGLTNLLLDALGPWTLSIQSVETSDSALHIEDFATPTPASLSFTAAAVTAGPITSGERFLTPITVAASAFGGSVRAEGELLPIDVRATLSIDLNGIALEPFAPYIPATIAKDFPTVALARGTLRVQGDFEASRDESDQLSISWKGPATIEGLRFDSAEPPAPMLSVGSLSADGALNAILPVGAGASGKWDGAIQMQSLTFDGDIKGPVVVAIGSLGVHGQATLDSASAAGTTFKGRIETSTVAFRANAIIDGDATLGSLIVAGIDVIAGEQRATIESIRIDALIIKAVVTMLAPPGAGAETEPAEPPIKRLLAIDPASLPQVRIGTLTINDGMLDVTDPDASPPTNVKMQDLDATLTNIATDGQTPADIKFTCIMQELGQVECTGKIDPVAVARRSDLNLKVQALPLKPYDAFSGRYAGYRIESGRASIDLPLTVRDGQVNGTLVFNLDNTHLGESVDSPDAPDIPLKLGLDLLRDSDDRVAGEIPLKGDMMDPEFSFSGLVWKAVLNLIAGIVTAPFKLLGELIGLAEGQDLSRIAFDPGSAELLPDALVVVDGMARALEKRQSLSLVIVGRFAEIDVPVIKAQMLRERLAASRKGAKPDPNDPAYRDALEDSYRDANSREAIVQARKDHPEPDKLIAFYEESLAATIEADPVRLAALAAERAEQVMNALIHTAGAPADRVSVALPEAQDEPADEPIAEFTLGK